MSPRIPPTGRPHKAAADTKSETMLLRLEAGEKEGFRAAAGVAGIDLSAWIASDCGEQHARNSRRRDCQFRFSGASWRI